MVMLIKDVTVHFTIKGTTTEEYTDMLGMIRETLNDRMFADEVTVHHCFLDRGTIEDKGFNTDLIDDVESLGSKRVCWFKTTPDVNQSRVLMLENLGRVGGVALFFGDIKEGVAAELEMCKELETPYLTIY